MVDSVSELKEAKEMRMMMASTMSQPTDDQRLTWTNSCGQYLTGLKVAHCETSVLQPGTLLVEISLVRTGHQSRHSLQSMVLNTAWPKNFP
jgi:hypothetical protein